MSFQIYLPIIILLDKISMFVLKEGIDRRLEDTLKVSSHASLTKDFNLHVCQH